MFITISQIFRRASTVNRPHAVDTAEFCGVSRCFVALLFVEQREQEFLLTISLVSRSCRLCENQDNMADEGEQKLVSQSPEKAVAKGPTAASSLDEI